MKKLTRTLIVLMAVFTVLSISTTMQARAANWTTRQEIVHQIADLGRSLGLAEDHPLIAICQDIWWADHDGRSLDSIGTYTSNRTGKTYGYTNGNFNAISRAYGLFHDGYNWYWEEDNDYWYRLSGTSKTYASASKNAELWATWGVTNNKSGITRSYDGYTWRWDDTNDYWYRLSGTSKTYASRSTSNTLWALWAKDQYDYRNNNYNNGGRNNTSGNQNNQNNQNNQTGGNSTYNYNLFTGYNWYNGVITPPNDQYIESEAKELVSLTYEYVKNMNSVTLQAKIMQVAVNIANGGSVALARDGFAKRNANAPYTDANNRSLLALARDVIWRNIAVKNGYTSAGIVASSNATHFSITGDSVTLKDDNGNVVNDNLRSPYTN